MYNIPSKTIFTGKNVIYLPSCHSTNDFLAENLQTPLFTEGSVVITDYQTKGKGQRGNIWEAEPGKNITASYLFCPHFLRPEQQFLLNIFSSLAVSDLLIELGVSEVQVKWPNDIYVSTQKICGILIQNFLNSKGLSNSIVGIGLNVNQEYFGEQRAISLKKITNVEKNLQEIFDLLCYTLEKRYSQLKREEFEGIRRAYIQKLYRFGQKSLFRDENGIFEGQITGVSDVGMLQIDREEGVQEYDFKKVEFL